MTCCVTLGKPLSLSESQMNQREKMTDMSLSECAIKGENVLRELESSPGGIRNFKQVCGL